MYWWLWLVLGLIFVGLEVLTSGGFYALFFGIGALAVGSLAGFGWSGPIWLQWLLFSAISLLSLLCFRPHLVRATRSKERPDPIDTLEGEIALLVDDLPRWEYRHISGYLSRDPRVKLQTVLLAPVKAAGVCA